MMPSYCVCGLYATRLAARALASLTRHILSTSGFQTELRSKLRSAALVTLARLGLDLYIGLDLYVGLDLYIGLGRTGSMYRT